MANILIFNKTTLLCTNKIQTSNPETIIVNDDSFAIITDNDYLNVKSVIKYKDNEIILFPSTPSDYHEWDNSIEQWALNSELQQTGEANRIRDLRLHYLQELDDLVQNPLRFATFTDEKKQQLVEYRQALLDIPQQQGFPLNVTFPTIPQ
jgi:hypothetical protein